MIDILTIGLLRWRLNKSHRIYGMLAALFEQERAQFRSNAEAQRAHDQAAVAAEKRLVAIDRFEKFRVDQSARIQ